MTTSQPNLQSKPPQPVGVSVSDLTVVAGQRTLLKQVNAEFRAGEITLIVGPSGVGKSVLLRLLAGLSSSFESAVTFTGNVEIDDRPIQAGDAGVVFQDFALFDEMTPLQNLNFAQSSSRQPSKSAKPRDVLRALRVPTNVPTSRLSGGQRQRLAIARTLMFNPNVVLYDEPTSGLDPLTGEQVANLIRDTHREYHKTSIIVTHDYHSLVPIADRLFILDPNQNTLLEMPRDQWSGLAAILEPMATRVRKQEEIDEYPLASALQSKLTDFFVGTSNTAVQFATSLVNLVPWWKNPQWGLRFFWHFLVMVMGPTACVYLLAAGIISGFVTTYFTFKFLPYANYTEPLLVEDLLTALGFATYRIFVPVLACVLVAARCGAAVSADIGGRQYGNQIDALKTFGTSPRQYLLTPIIWSFLIGTPVLSFVSFFAARWVSLSVFVFTHPQLGANFWHFHFHRGMEQPDQFLYRGFGWLIAKLLCSGMGAAVIAYYEGLKPKYSSPDVSQGVTSTILKATLFVLMVHLIFSLFEFENIVPGGKTP